MGEPKSIEEARAVKQSAVNVFQRFGRVAGIGIVREGAGYGLKVNLEKLPPAAAGIALPQEIDGVPVRVEIVGKLKKRT